MKVLVKFKNSQPEQTKHDKSRELLSRIEQSDYLPSGKLVFGAEKQMVQQGNMYPLRVASPHLIGLTLISFFSLPPYRAGRMARLPLQTNSLSSFILVSFLLPALHFLPLVVYKSFS